MKKVFSYSISLLFIFLSQSVFSQIHLQFLEESTTKNFQEIVDKVEEYYQTHEKDKQYKQYKQYSRWKDYNESRLDVNGCVKNVSQYNFNEYYYYEQQWNQKTQNQRRKIGGDWFPVGPVSYSNGVNGNGGGLGRINCMAIDPDDEEIIYLGTPQGGVWRGTGGIGDYTWTPLTDGMPRIGVSEIVIDPTSPTNNRTIYLMTGDSERWGENSIGVLKSIDNGRTWYQTNIPVMNSRKLVMDPSNSKVLLLGTSNNGIWKTKDGGETWYNVILRNSGGSILRNVYDIEYIHNHPNHIVMACSDGIYKSTNYGETWFKCAFTPPTGTQRIELGVTPANPNYVYAVCGGPNGFLGLYRSEDKGLSYFLPSTSPNILGRSATGNDNDSQARYDLAIAVSPWNEDIVHVGGINCWVSRNEGAGWSITSYWVKDHAPYGSYVHADIHDLIHTGNYLYCVNDGGIYRSSNNGGIWHDFAEGFQITQLYHLTPSDNSSHIYYGAQDNGLNVLSGSHAVEWSGGDGMKTILKSGYVFGTTQFGRVARLHKGDVDNVTPPTIQYPSSLWNVPFTAPSSKSFLLIGYRDIFKSTNNGGSWTNISSGQIQSSSCRTMAISPSNESVIYIGQTNKIYKTLNGGSTWAEVKSVANTNDLKVHPNNSNIVIAVSSSDVKRTTDGGNTWYNIKGSLPSVSLNTVVFDPNTSKEAMYIGTDIGVFYRDNTMSDWIPFYHKLPNTQIADLVISKYDNKLYAGTFGRGVWKTDLYGKTCASKSNITEDVEGYKYYVGQEFESTATIEPDADATFASSTSIVLKDGFKTLPEAKFRALISDDVCSEGVNRTAYQKIGTYAGPLPKTLSVEESVSIEEGNEFFVFPNPTIDNLYIQYNLTESVDVTIEIYSLTGGLVLQKDNVLQAKGKNVEKIKVVDLTTGTYLVKVVDNTNNELLMSKTFVKK